MPSTTKKVPNFAKIHKKLFAKSESIVDAKKRVIDRHTEMSNIFIFVNKFYIYTTFLNMYLYFSRIQEKV